MKPTPEEAAELVKLRSNSVITGYLNRRLAAAADSLVYMPDDDQFRTLQGQAQILKELLKDIRGD